jgi:hypothetical protein
LQGRAFGGSGRNPFYFVRNSTPAAVSAVPAATAVVILDQAEQFGRHVSAVVQAERRHVLLKSPLSCRQCDL